MVGKRSGGWEKDTREVRREMERVEGGRDSGGEVRSLVTDETQDGQCRLPVGVQRSALACELGWREVLNRVGESFAGAWTWTSCWTRLTRVAVVLPIKECSR